MNINGSKQIENDAGHSIISPFKETHAWTKVRCADCGVDGVTLVDTETKHKRDHFCYLHNPAVQEANS
jgi:hypothetical protein